MFGQKIGRNVNTEARGFEWETFCEILPLQQTTDLRYKTCYSTLLEIKVIISKSVGREIINVTFFTELLLRTILRTIITMVTLYIIISSTMLRELVSGCWVSAQIWLLFQRRASEGTVLKNGNYRWNELSIELTTSPMSKCSVRYD
jgi:hypothetical protein